MDLRGRQFRWILTEPLPAASVLCAQQGYDPLIAQLLAQRDVGDADAATKFFDPKLGDLHDPRRLFGATAAAERLIAAVRAHEPIAIYGDYDVDGVCATAILFHMIRGADSDADVRTYVPHRLDEGYGLNVEAIEGLAAEGAKVVISVDCGITACAEADAASAAGVDLIITDHHEPGPTLPAAHTLVHPLLETDEGPYPWRDLCGAGVAFKVAWEFARLWCGTERVSDTFRTLLVDLLPFAAMATVADVVPLIDENRAIVIHGLRHIQRTPFVGLNALIAASRLGGEIIDSYDIGFKLGPRLNACGRMGHAADAVRLLTDVTEDAAADIAANLNRVNEKRRKTSSDIFEVACEQVEARGFDQPDKRAIVLADPDWHPGVVGIVCSRLVEKYGRPTVLLGGDQDVVRGSARSIDGFNIHQAFGACGEHLETFGGHAMAAGLTCQSDRVDAFREALLAYALERIEAENLTPAIRIDAESTIDRLTGPVVEQIERIGPFGRSNPRPMVLLRGVTIAGRPEVRGAGGKHLSLTVRQGNRSLRCIAWGMGDLVDRLAVGQTIDLAVEPKINEWRGVRKVEAVVCDMAIG
jgi:single-stranded-DNA-specific exonuclease